MLSRTLPGLVRSLVSMGLLVLASGTPPLRAETLLLPEVGRWFAGGLLILVALVTLCRLLRTVVWSDLSLACSTGYLVAVPAFSTGTTRPTTGLFVSARRPSGTATSAALTTTASRSAGSGITRISAPRGTTRTAAIVSSTVSVTGAHGLDAAVDAEHGVDGRANVILEAREVQQIALGIEGDAQSLTVERYGCAAHRDRPRHSTDFGQCGHDLRPGRSQQLDLPALVCGGMSLRALSWSSMALGFGSSAGSPRGLGAAALLVLSRIGACRRGVAVFRTMIDRTVVVGGIRFASAGPAIRGRRVIAELAFAFR